MKTKSEINYSAAPYGHYTHGFVTLDENNRVVVQLFKSEDDAWIEYHLARTITGPKRIALMRIKKGDTEARIKDRIAMQWADAGYISVTIRHY